MKQTLKDFCSYPVLLFKACITLITSPKLLIYALIPYLIALIIFGISFYFGTKYIDDIVNLITEKASGFLYYVFGSLAFFIICIIASILSFVGMNTIGGFFIDLMLEKILIKDGLIHQEGIPLKMFFLRSFKSILADMFIAFIVTLSFTSSFALGFIPFISIIPLLIGCFLLGLGMFNRIMSILLLGISKRINFIKQNKLRTLSLGIFFTFIFLIPFANIILMPPCLIMTCKVYKQGI